MIKSSYTQLDDIKILSFEFRFKNNSRKKRIILKAEDLLFKILGKSNKKDVNRKRLISVLETKNESDIVFFKISVLVEYSFLKLKEKKPREEEEFNYVITGLIPQVIAFLRGYLFAATQNSPVVIMLPFVDIFESYKQKHIEILKPQK